MFFIVSPLLSLIGPSSVPWSQISWFSFLLEPANNRAQAIVHWSLDIHRYCKLLP